jgi:hypothetical protein
MLSSGVTWDSVEKMGFKNSEITKEPESFGS